MVLDHRAKQPIEIVVRHQGILELVKADHRQFAVPPIQDAGCTGFPYRRVREPRTSFRPWR